MLAIAFFLITWLFILDIFILVRIGILKVPKRGVKIIPIDPNKRARPCQFCGKLPASLSPDGYYACPTCMVTKLHKLPAKVS